MKCSISFQEQDHKLDEIDIFKDQEDKISQTDFVDKELFSLKERVKHFELVEAAYDEELSTKIDENNKLSTEVNTLKGTIDELLQDKNKERLGRQDSSLEFESLKNILKSSTSQLEESYDSKDNIQHDLMSEIRVFEEKLKEKDSEIIAFDQKLKEKDQALEKLHKILDFNSQFLLEIQAMNRSIEKRTKGDCHDEECLEIQQNFKESLEPETLQDFSQVCFYHSSSFSNIVTFQLQAVQKLKENIEKILKDKRLDHIIFTSLKTLCRTHKI